MPTITSTEHLQCSFARLDSGWGARVHNPLPGGVATGLSGEVVTLVRRDGSSQRVRLGAQQDAYNGGRTAVYAMDQSHPSRRRDADGDRVGLRELSRDIHEIPAGSAADPEVSPRASRAEKLSALEALRDEADRLASELVQVQQRISVLAREIAEGA